MIYSHAVNCARKCAKLTQFMRRLMQQLLADGVKWVDMRLAFTFRYFKEGQETPEDTYDEMFRVFGEEIKSFKASEEGKEFWGMRMIWTGIRVLDTRKIVEDMDACIAIKVYRPSCSREGFTNTKSWHIHIS